MFKKIELNFVNKGKSEGEIPNFSLNKSINYLMVNSLNYGKY